MRDVRDQLIRTKAPEMDSLRMGMGWNRGFE